MILGYSTTFSRYLHYIPCITYIVNDSIENPIYVDCRLSGLKIENLSAKEKKMCICIVATQLILPHLKKLQKLFVLEFEEKLM